MGVTGGMDTQGAGIEAMNIPRTTICLADVTIKKTKDIVIMEAEV